LGSVTKKRTISESFNTTPARVTRRSASIQSLDEGEANIDKNKTIAAATEGLPIGRRTRSNSITSDDGKNDTPTKKNVMYVKVS